MIKKIFLIGLALFMTIPFLSCGGKKMVLREVPADQQKILAILKFKNQSGTDEFDPWEMGISSMLMTDLSKIGVFKIVSRERMREILKEQELGMSGIIDTSTAQQLGKMLGAEYILMGTFVEFRGQLRIEAQIFNTEKANLVKADEITGETDQFFDLEKELAIKISEGLDVALSSKEKSTLAKAVQTKSVEASLENYAGVENVEKAKILEDKGKKDEAQQLVKQAEKKFKKALEYDPEYEEAKDNLNRLGLAVPISF